jgi:4-amino-4-deoxy-L-arabinose transferase-like glycosyltransferase
VTEPPFGRRGLVVAAAVACVALVVRLRDVDRLGLLHYDEGVYAASASKIRDGTFDSADAERLARHAPPAVPYAVAGVAKLLDARPSRVAFGISIGAGALAAALASAFAARAVGRGAGFAAGAAVAFDPTLVVWSRTAMTDAPFLAAFLLALFVAAEAERRRSLLLALLSGLFSGVAWSVKYHGWFAAVAAIVFRVGAAPAVDRRGSFARALVLTIVAAACAPFSWTRAGGDARFLAPEHWLRSLATHAGYLSLDGAAAFRAVAAAIVVLAFAIPRLRRIVASTPHGAALLAACALFFIATPCYRPYPRLALPAVALASTTAVVALFSLVGRPLVSRLLAAAIVGASIVGYVATERGPKEPSDGLERAVEEIVAAAPPNVAIAVLGEPAAYAALLERGAPARYGDAPHDALSDLRERGEVFLLAGYFARKNRSIEAYAIARGVEFLRTTTAPVAGHDARRFDDFEPRDARGAAALDPATYAPDLIRARLR